MFCIIACTQVQKTENKKNFGDLKEQEPRSTAKIEMSPRPEALQQQKILKNSTSPQLLIRRG